MNNEELKIRLNYLAQRLLITYISGTVLLILSLLILKNLVSIEAYSYLTARFITLLGFLNTLLFSFYLYAHFKGFRSVRRVGLIRIENRLEYMINLISISSLWGLMVWITISSLF